MIGAAEELDCFSAHIRLKEPDKSEDKAEAHADSLTRLCPLTYSALSNKRSYHCPDIAIKM
ncbi:hypothetical protein GW17_00049728 [Ensete ventricosum]|nr:hypothetical protein GW17_00049728 [Ensete ventricosum]